MEVVITSIVPNCHQSVTVLFDLCSTYLYVSTYFSYGFDLLCDCIHMHVHVFTLVESFSGGSGVPILSCVFGGSWYLDIYDYSRYGRI